VPGNDFARALVLKRPRRSETVTVVPCDRETRWPLSTTDVRRLW
jgi:hypothetical protein